MSHPDTFMNGKIVFKVIDAFEPSTGADRFDRHVGRPAVVVESKPGPSYDIYTFPSPGGIADAADAYSNQTCYVGEEPGNIRLEA